MWHEPRRLVFMWVPRELKKLSKFDSQVNIYFC